MVPGLLAPALVDFKYMLKTSMDNISFTYTFFSFGYLCGSLCMLPELAQYYYLDYLVCSWLHLQVLGQRPDVHSDDHNYGSIVWTHAFGQSVLDALLMFLPDHTGQRCFRLRHLCLDNRVMGWQIWANPAQYANDVRFGNNSGPCLHDTVRQGRCHQEYESNYERHPKR